MADPRPCVQPLVPLPGGPADQQPRGLHPGGHVRQKILDGAELRQRLPELAALPGVAEARVQGGLADPQGLGGDADPAAVQGAERDLQPFPLLTQAVFHGNPAVVQGQRADRVAAHAHHFLHRPFSSPARSVSTMKTENRALPLPARQRREDQVDAAHAAVGHEHLVAVEQIPVRLPRGPGFERRGIRAGIRLGEAESPDLTAGGQRVQKTLLCPSVPNCQSGLAHTLLCTDTQRPMAALTRLISSITMVELTESSPDPP